MMLMDGHKSSTLGLIMAGGSGTRFWPVSQPEFPKQFLSLVGNRSLIQQTVDRIQTIIPLAQTYVCALESHKHLLEAHLTQLSQRWILEPSAKNTAACLMLSTSQLLKQGFSEDSVMVVLPADHFIKDTDHFCQLINKAICFAQERDFLVTLGIHPKFAHTGYGYIVPNKALGDTDFYSVEKFLEKPSKEAAETLLSQGQSYWNSGMFVWKLSTIRQAFETWLSEPWSKIHSAEDSKSLKTVYETLPSVPIDKAVMEKAKNVCVLPSDIDWTDLGSWNALYEFHQSTPKQNICLSGEVKGKNFEGCLVRVDPAKKVALIGVEDLLIIEEGDKLLITKRQQDQTVKEFADQF